MSGPVPGKCMITPVSPPLKTVQEVLRYFRLKKYKMERGRIRRVRIAWKYNRNHLVKSKKGVFKAGYKLRKRRWYWRGNSGRQNVIKEVQADEHLQAVIGVERATRGQILRLIWVYIRNNNLQNPLNRKMIIPDQTLAAVIGANEILCCQMMKNLEQHIVTPK
jgi:chromatin remodeling complex protein RSC6